MPRLPPDRRDLEEPGRAKAQRSAWAAGGSIEGYSYSAANKNSGLVWDESTFRDCIKAPQAKIPSTTMVFAGLKSEQEIDDLVAFLKQIDADGKKK
ncbi:Cytochrome c class I precursor [Bosea sp. LC85]|nr:Cytochrome c class I precursor [Bosea sp. LC85]